jgi:hypothetical protein
MPMSIGVSFTYMHTSVHRTILGTRRVMEVILILGYFLFVMLRMTE